MKKFCFTVDDNIRCLKEIAEGNLNSIFEHPYLALYLRLHKKYNLKVQLNLFYETIDFNLSAMTKRYKKEWQENADWLKLSFHSKSAKSRAYENSTYEEVFEDIKLVNESIISFAGEDSLAKTTTIHFCLLTSGGINAVKDNGVRGLLGLYGTKEDKRYSYQNTDIECEELRKGKIICSDGVYYSGIDIVLNNFSINEILRLLDAVKERDFIKVMIHEQYFYKDYKNYQKDFDEKLDETFKFLTEKGYNSIFYEERLTNGERDF